MNAPTIESDQAEILEVIKILQKKYDNKFGNWAFFFIKIQDNVSSMKHKPCV